MENKGKFAMTPNAGLLVILSGLILLAGGGVKDPMVFNWDMFDFRRLVAAPIVMLCGIIIEIVAIMGRTGRKGDE